MSEFFAEGGFGMYPVLLFGALAVAAAVLSLLRLERRYVWLMISLALTSLASGLLGCAFGLIEIFKYVQHVPAAEQMSMVTLGISQVIRPVALALMLDVITGLIASLGALRAARLAPASLPAA